MGAGQGARQRVSDHDDKARAATIFDVGLSYKFKLPGRFFERYSFTTQLNVNNALNHYKVWVLPSNTNGAVLNARLSAMPRQFIWTNTIGF